MQQDALVARRETEHLRCLLGIHTKHVPDCDDLALADGQQRDGVIDDTPQLQDTEALLRLLVPRDGRHRPAPVAAEPVGVDRGLTTKAAERSGSGFPDTRAPGLVDEDPADPGLQRRPPLKRRQRLEDRQPRVLNRVLGRLCRARVVARAAQQHGAQLVDEGPKALLVKSVHRSPCLASSLFVQAAALALHV